MAWPMAAMGIASLLLSLYQAYQKKREMDKGLSAAGSMSQTPNYVAMQQPQVAPVAQKQPLGDQEEWLKTLLEQLMKKQTGPQPVSQPASNPLYDILSRNL